VPFHAGQLLNLPRRREKKNVIPNFAIVCSRIDTLPLFVIFVIVIVIVIVVMQPLEASALYEDIRRKTDVDFSAIHFRCIHVIVMSVGLQLNPTLLRLNLRNCALNHCGAEAIAEALKGNSVLQKLELWHTRIGGSGAAAIADALRVNSVLQDLGLGYNRIGDSGAAAIAEALKVNSSLQKLELGDNRIGDSGAAAIAEALKVNSVLQKLGLSYNKIGDSGDVALARALMQHSTLRQLNLCTFKFGDSGAAAIEELLERSLLQLEQAWNGIFPKVLNNGSTRKYHFLCALSDTGFRSFIVNDVPPALWPHALARVTMYPSLIFLLLLQIPGS
jgi:Ran GTPase-activating protein (RanGAP) involved in mRNA processing and transport